MSKTSILYAEPTEEEIARYAYFLWESEGRCSGRDLDYWLEAKRHLTVDRQYEAGLLEGMPPKKTKKALNPDETLAPVSSAPESKRVKNRQPKAPSVREPEEAFA
jgi:hypothetical protein